MIIDLLPKFIDRVDGFESVDCQTGEVAQTFGSISQCCIVRHFRATASRHYAAVNQYYTGSEYIYFDKMLIVKKIESQKNKLKKKKRKDAREIINKSRWNTKE